MPIAYSTAQTSPGSFSGCHVFTQGGRSPVALRASNISGNVVSKMVMWIWIMYLLTGSMWLGIKINAFQTLPEGEVILEEAVTSQYWWMEEKWVNASSLFYWISTQWSLWQMWLIAVLWPMTLWQRRQSPKKWVSGQEVIEINNQNFQFQRYHTSPSSYLPRRNFWYFFGCSKCSLWENNEKVLQYCLSTVRSPLKDIKNFYRSTSNLSCSLAHSSTFH